MGSAAVKLTRCDVLICADFTVTGERAFRLAGEIRFLHGRHFDVGLLQYRTPAPGRVISPEIQGLVVRGLASLCRSQGVVECRTAIIHAPAGFEAGATRIRARKAVEIAYGAEDFDVLPALNDTETQRYPADRLARIGAPDGARIEPVNWLPAPDFGATPVDRTACAAPAVAWIVGRSADLSKIAGMALRIAPGGACADHMTIGGSGASGDPTLPDISGLALGNIVRSIDAFVVTQEAFAERPPDTIIAGALAAGRPVFMPKAKAAEYGRGPIYCAAEDLERKLSGALGGRRKAARKSGAAFVTACRRGAITAIRQSSKRPVRGTTDRVRPVLCVTTNGVGIGHLARMLAIARRLDHPAVFATQAAAVGAVQDLGFAVEYIPSAQAVGRDFADWDRWFQAELEQLIDRHDPAVVAYDGNHLSWGLINSALGRGDVRLAWIRRGMWGAASSPYLGNSRWCDLIIEPGEIAAERDNGATARLRRQAEVVDPILLLEAEELLDRETAAGLLGLNPARTNVLVQLGAGHNRDLIGILDTIVTHLRRQPGLHICIAEWANGHVPLNLWPDVRILRGFPISQYLRAFDFCISAAGYNSFHELISFGVPTIFVVNEKPTVDDQPARAKFAQDRAAAFTIPEKELDELPALVALLQAGKARSFLTERCLQMKRGNGAITAAARLDGLAEPPQSKVKKVEMT